MGFDVGAFVNNETKQLTDRATSGATDKIDGLLGGQGFVNLAASILSSGGAISTLTSIASIKFDQVVNKAADDFFGKLKGSILGQGKGRTPSPTNILTEATSKIAGDALKYPSDLGNYSIMFQFMKYNRPAPLVASTDKNTVAILLPLPRELLGGHDISIQSGETGTPGALLDAAALANQHGVTNGTAASIAYPLVSAGLTILGQISPEAVSAVEQTAGAIVNPNISAIYKGPVLREFTFSWEFSPNNPAESKKLQAILQEIQKRSLAGFTISGSSAYMSYPEMVIPRILPDGPGQIGDLMKFKKCLVKAIKMNYGPSGIPAFFRDTQAPTFIGVTMAVQEIEYFTTKDYGGTDGAGFSTDIAKAATDLKTSLINTLASAAASAVS